MTDTAQTTLAYAITLRERGEYADALQYAEQSRELAQSEGDICLEVKAALETALLLKMNDRAEAALTHLNWVVTLARGDQRAELIPVEWYIVRAYVLYVDTARNVHYVHAQKLLDILDLGEEFVQSVGRPDWRDGLLSLRGRVYFDLARDDEAIEALEEAVEISREQRSMSPAFALKTHLRVLADGYRQVDRPADAVPIYEELTTNDAVLTRLAAFCGLGRAMLELERPEEAVAWGEKALPLTNSMFPRQRAAPIGLLVDAYRAVGDVDRAGEMADEMLRIADATGSIRTRCYALMDIADVAIDRGELDAARVALAESMELAKQLDARTSHTESQDEVQKRVDRLEAEGAEGEHEDSTKAR